MNAKVLRAKVLEDLTALEGYRPAWDELAVTSGRPYCAPGWMLAWWRFVAGTEARLRVVVVEEHGRLVGVAPFVHERGRGGHVLRLLASGTSSPVEPLAMPGTERAVARVIAGALTQARPRPTLISFEGLPQSSPWPRLLQEEWPGPVAAALARDRTIASPTLNLRGLSYEQWLGSRSSNMRGQLRRGQRQLVALGAHFRFSADADELRGDLEDFARLHHARWSPRGGSEALDPHVERMLGAAGQELLHEGRFRLCSLEVDQEVVASMLFIVAGAEVAYWLGGFDEAWARYRPALQILDWVVADSIERGHDRLDLGPGDQPYKYRFADGEERLERWHVIPWGPAYLPVRAWLGAVRTTRNVASRLPETTKERLRRVVGRLPS